jgi:hypothetical protein
MSPRSFGITASTNRGHIRAGGTMAVVGTVRKTKKFPHWDIVEPRRLSVARMPLRVFRPDENFARIAT